MVQADEGEASAGLAPKTTEGPEHDVLEELRETLVEWQGAGVMQSKEEVDDVLASLAKRYGTDMKELRMLWHSIAQQSRRIGMPVYIYVDMALQHHGIKVEVVDLGQFSARHSNSCMFLTCAAAIADRRLRGFADAELPGALGEAIAAAAPYEQTASIEDLVKAHRENRASMLGCMADALRDAACQVLEHQKEFFFPYFHPVRSKFTAEVSEAAYDAWLEKLRGDDEGDELVMLALAELIGMAVQPVHQSGYRVPLMDPTDVAKDDCIVYWGNDDKHWVWLRVLGS